MGRVQDKIAIVTGAGQGLGAASARLLAREGARVVATDLNAASGDAVAQSIRDAGGQAIFLRADAAVEGDWRAVIAETRRAFGGLHILVNNAGVAFPAGSVEALSLDEWRTMLSINLESVFLGTQHAIALMRETGEGGSIVNFSSILGITANPAQAAYGASKGGVRSFTKSAALHCAQAGYRIRVNSVHPGYIWTPMLEETLQKRGDFAEHKRIVEAKTPLGHCGEPDDIAYGVLYLASDESKFVTGAELVIDGGYTAQ